MPKVSINRRTPALAVALSLSLASLGLAACGGSSSTSSSGSTSTSASAAATSASARTGARNGGRFKALRACLQKNGITLPQRTPGTRRPPGAGGGLLGGGGPQLPKGVTRAQLQSAMSKCGATGFFAGGARANNPAFKQSLAKFAACMRQNGVNLPAPNTSGNGPVFSTKGLNRHSKTFAAADAKCQVLLSGAFRRGGGPPGAASGAPGAGGPPGAPGAGGASGAGGAPAPGGTAGTSSGSGAPASQSQ